MSGVHTVPSRRGARKTLQTKTVLYTKAKHASPSEKEAPAGVLWELGGGGRGLILSGKGLSRNLNIAEVPRWRTAEGIHIQTSLSMFC